MTTVKIRVEHDFNQVRQALSSTDWPIARQSGTLGQWYRSPETQQPPRCAWLAYCRDELIGVASVSDPVDGSGGRPVLEVFVSPSHRRRGLGRALVARAQRAYACLAADHGDTQLYHHLGVREIKIMPPPASEADQRCRFVQARLATGTMHRRRTP